MVQRQDTAIHEGFLAALKEQGLIVDSPEKLSLSFGNNQDMANVLRILGGHNRNIYFIVYEKKAALVHLHIRSEGKGFWGITQRTLEILGAFKEGLKIPIWLVLLIGRQDRFIADGYIIPELGTPPMKRAPTLQKRGNYKINERGDLDDDYQIRSVTKIAEQLKSLLLQS